MDNMVTVTSQDDLNSYVIVLTQNGSDSLQFDLATISKSDNTTTSKSSHVVKDIKIDGDVITGNVVVVFWPTPINVTVNVTNVTVDTLGQMRVYPLSKVDRVNVLMFFARSGFPETGVMN